jgi:hypothetical protein
MGIGLKRITGLEHGPTRNRNIHGQELQHSFWFKRGFQMIEKVCQTPLVWNHVHGCLDIPLGLNNISGILPPFSTISGGWERSHRHGILEKRQGLGWVGTPISRVEIHIGSGASFAASHYSKTGLYFKFAQGSL